MELNREQVVNALECCIEGTSEACFNCAFGLTPSYPVCKTMVQKHALAIIRELTEENERLSRTRYMVTPDGRTEMIPTVESVKADTVRKMQERLKACAECVGECSVDNPLAETYSVVREDTIDQIAKELLEGEK